MLGCLTTSLLCFWRKKEAQNNNTPNDNKNDSPIHFSIQKKSDHPSSTPQGNDSARHYPPQAYSHRRRSHGPSRPSHPKEEDEEEDEEEEEGEGREEALEKTVGNPSEGEYGAQGVDARDFQAEADARKMEEAERMMREAQAAAAAWMDAETEDGEGDEGDEGEGREGEGTGKREKRITFTQWVLEG